MRLDIPYLSQWDPDAHLSRGDCGIVCAAMIARANGSTISPDQMIQRAGLPIGRHSYDFNQIKLAAYTAGLTLAYQRPCELSMILSELDAQRPTITLLRYGELPGNQDDFDGSHFVVVVGYDTDHVLIHDPNFWQPRRAEGAYRAIPRADFDRAIGFPLIATGNQRFQSLLVIPKR